MTCTILLLAVFGLVAEAQGLYCFQNHTISTKFYIKDSFRSGRCKQTDSTEALACVRVEAATFALGNLIQGSILFGDCVPMSQCQNISCDGYKQKVGIGGQPESSRPNVCNITCCFSDNCNNETVATLLDQQVNTRGAVPVTSFIASIVTQAATTAESGNASSTVGAERISTTGAAEPKPSLSTTSVGQSVEVSSIQNAVTRSIKRATTLAPQNEIPPATKSSHVSTTSNASTTSENILTVTLKLLASTVLFVTVTFI